EVELIYPIMQRTWQLHHSNHPHKLLLIPNYLCNVLLELQALYLANAPVTKSKPEELVANFKKLLLAEIYNHPKPSDLAKMLHVSTNHLNKVLNKLTKKTTSKWIAEQRILEAKYLLSYSTSSISEVAYRLGFSQPAHFTNFFKSQTGILPTEYQKD
ncbi:MAG: helix-turn-helix domain-containing protein, partial [Bacteroidota bacterium]